MRRLTACAFLAVTMGVAACGTTVPLSQTVAGAQSSAGTTGAAVGQLSAGSVNASNGARPLGVSGAEGANSGSPAGFTTSVAGSGTVGGTAAAAHRARGVTATTVTIGAAIATGTGGVADSFGISGAGTLNEQDIWNAVVADVNKSGGVLGRKLVLYVHSVDLATYVSNPAQAEAQACADFRDDHPVFAAMISISDPLLRTCLASMGSPLIVYDANVASIVPAAAFTGPGANYLYIPDGITDERLAHLYVQSLMARSFTSPWDTTNGAPGIAPVKLGLIHADTPDQDNLYADYAKELASYGLKFTDTVTYSGDVSTALATTQSTVLKFASEGITHVFGASAFFLRDAESQHYRPRYAYLPALGAFGAANSPAAQLNGAMTIGWAPAVDVNAAQDPGPNPGDAHCRAVTKAAGLTPSNRQDLELIYAVCDAVYSFRAALTAGESPSVAGLRRGYEALGTRFGPALAFSNSFGPDHHYGVDSVRDVAWNSGCGCFEYTSRTNRS